MRVVTILCALLTSLLISCSGKTITVKEAPTPPDYCTQIVDMVLDQPGTRLPTSVQRIFAACTFFLVHSYRCADPESAACEAMTEKLMRAKEAASEIKRQHYIDRLVNKGRAA